MIDNKDYNYTLVVSGQNFQIVHHDDGKNLTYKHGVNVSYMTVTCSNVEDFNSFDMSFKLYLYNEQFHLYF